MIVGPFCLRELVWFRDAIGLQYRVVLKNFTEKQPMVVFEYLLCDRNK